LPWTSHKWCHSLSLSFSSPLADSPLVGFFTSLKRKTLTLNFPLCPPPPPSRLFGMCDAPKEALYQPFSATFFSPPRCLVPLVPLQVTTFPFLFLFPPLFVKRTRYWLCYFFLFPPFIELLSQPFPFQQKPLHSFPRNPLISKTRRQQWR